MNSPNAFFLSTPSRTKPLTLAVLAYASVISASVGAAAALVGSGAPLDFLVAVV